MTGALLLVGGCYLVIAAGLTSVRVHAHPAGHRGAFLHRHRRIPRTRCRIDSAASRLDRARRDHDRGAAQRAAGRPLILSRYAAAVTVAFVALLTWLTIETQGGDILGLAERLTSSVQITWPFIVAVALRRTGSRPPRPEQAMSRPEAPEITPDARPGSEPV
jgi:hypothetical protein